MLRNKDLKILSPHLACSPPCSLSNFVIFNLWFILTYPIDLIRLAFIINGGRWQHNWRTPIVWSPQIFSYYIFTYLENFICLARVVKILKNPSIVALEISHILFTCSNFIFFFVFTYSESFMCLPWMIEKFEFWETPILVSQILSNFIFPSYLPILKISCV